MKMKNPQLLLGMIIGLTIIPTENASADLVLISDKNAFADNDSIDWGQLGGDSFSLPNSVSAQSLQGLDATVTTSDTNGLLRVDEGRSWISNFSINEHLLNNNSYEYHPLTIIFNRPVIGVGAQIQPDVASGVDETFTATIEAFSGDVSLGRFNVQGIRGNNEDGSATFIGIVDTERQITSVTFGIKDFDPTIGDFAISHLFLSVAKPIPTPSSLILGSCALIIGVCRSISGRILS